MKGQSDFFVSRFPVLTVALFSALLVGTILPAAAEADALEAPQILWTWSFTPAPTWDNVVAVAGGPDINGDGWPDALVSSEDYRLRALNGHSTGTPGVIWTFGGTNQMPVSEKAIAFYPDRNGDGMPEILYSTGYADQKVYMINTATGIPEWSFDHRTTGCTETAWMYSAVPLKDINGDRVTDVVAAVASRCNQVVTLNGKNGALIWLYQANDGVRAVMDAGDLDGDGVDDVLAAAGANSADNRLFLLSGKPTALQRLVWQHFAGNFVDSVATVQDFTSDGYEEAIGGSWDHTVFAVSGHSSGTVPSPLWETSVSGSVAWVQDTIRIPDIDGDCVDDIAVGSWTPATRILSGRTGAVIWSRNVGTATNAAYGAILPDVTGDMQWDYVVGSLNTGFVDLFSGADGTKIWEWTAPTNVRSVGWIGDISGDGLPDILVGLQDAAQALAFASRTAPGCVRPAREVSGLMVSRLDALRIRLAWSASTDGCHARYRVFAVPANVKGEKGCFASLVDITGLDEDADPVNEQWTGPGSYFGYLVIDESAGGGRGPLGHFRR